MTHTAMDNSAPFATRPDSTYKSGKAVQTTGATSAFGLRREESLKIQPGWADRGDTLVLKDSWTKGGRSREIPMLLYLRSTSILPDRL